MAWLNLPECLASNAGEAVILNSKQLEELENIQDASGEFEEEAGDSDAYVEGVENALAWRRGMIERAVAQVRKLVRKPVDSLEGIASGSLVYLKDAKRFGRVNENQDGNVELSFVGPAPSPVAAKPEKAAKGKKAVAKEAAAPVVKGPSKAELKKAEREAKALEKAEAKAKADKAKADAKAKAAEAEAKAKAKAKAAAEAKAKAKAKAEADKAKAKAKLKTKQKPAAKAKPKAKVKPKAKAATAKKKVTKTKQLKAPTRKLPAKKPVKTAAKKPLPKAKAKPVAAKKKALKKPLKKAGGSKMMDPVADPNSYIRGNFRLMSNKELSHVTGLSEHTIRRKLGEWGLKRI